MHFNFKTESDIFDYFNECSLLSIKNSSYLNDGSTNDQIVLIFTDLLEPIPFGPFIFFLLLWVFTF
jgi:hypothetical protein